MHVLVASLSFRLVGLASLKDKRRIRTSLLERLRHTYGCSVAEIGHPDSRDHLDVGVALVGSDRRVLQATMDGIVARATVEVGDPTEVQVEFR